MKQSHQSVARTGLLAVALAITGCAATGGAGDMYSDATSSNTDDVASRGDVDRIVTSSAITSGSAGTSGSKGATDSGSAGMQDESGDQPAAAATRTPTPNGTVLSIAAPPAENGASTSDASMGASGTAGTSGSGDGGQAYRVMVRMDDGSTQAITYTGTPDFRSGERINVTGGAIRR
jgi:hypothetical protein